MCRYAGAGVNLSTDLIRLECARAVQIGLAFKTECGREDVNNVN